MNMTVASQQVAGSAKGWNIALWVVQVVLGGMFIMAGVLKTTTPIAELSMQMNWAADIPEALVRFIGATQLLGGIGLILPSLLRVRPSLTIAAGWSLAFVMLLALLFHVVRGENAVIGTNMLLGVAAAFIAWGRTTRAPISAR